jgi:hypothetical protein
MPVSVGRLRARACWIAALALCLLSAGAASARAAGGIPPYNHIFLIIEENHNYNQIIGNPAAPIINALAGDYGSATKYTGVGDPSEPNYVAMLGGSTFGINSDDPYWFPGHTVNQPNLMSQLDQAGLSWKGYFQGMPYAGYRGYCFPAKCNGIPDSDTQYVAKHNGIVNFASEQNATEFAKMQPYSQLSSDLAGGNVPNLSYIVPDECHDMHGAPPWCLDSAKPGDVDDTWLVATADAFVGKTVSAITSSSLWKTGQNAIVITWDEGNVATNSVPTIVMTNNGPRGVQYNVASNHYSLLASIQDAFGLGCLQNSCTATPMAPLFSSTGSSTTPALPAPFVPAPDGTDTVSATGAATKGKPFTPSGGGWQLAPSPSIGNLDNNLAAVSAGSASDAWAVGTYYPQGSPNVLATLGEHWDGSTWTAYPLPDVGPNENTLLGVSDGSTGSAWAVGYYVNAEYKQTALVEHYNGSSWQVVSVPQPGGTGNILYGVAAISDSDVWVVGGQQDAAGIWHPLAEHWNGSSWTVSSPVDPNGGGNLLYSVSAVSNGNVYASGQTGSGFPSSTLAEQWNGSKWTQLSSPADATESLAAFGSTATGSALTLVGTRETDSSPFTTMVASGAPSSLGLVSSPNVGTGEQDLFAATTATDGTTWADGWYIDPSSGNHETLMEQGVGGVWSVVPTINPGANGDNGFAGIATIPGGGVWAVGIATNTGNPSTLVEFHP